MRALGYFQFDNDEGAADPTGARALALSFESYCADRNHTHLGLFQDELRGGERTGYREMVEHIRDTGLGYLVVVPSIGHLGQTLHEQVGRVLELDALHCQVVCDDPESPDPLQGAMRLWSGVGAGSRRERIREGMRAKAARGLGLGKPPYGFRVQYDGSFRMVAEEADVVRSIFRMYLDDDLGVRSVAQRLNDAGTRTRRGMRWSMVTVRDILRNHAYIGTYQRFGLRITGSYQAVVDPADFRRVQDKMTSRSPGRRYPRGDPFLLAGLLYCGYCGQRMMGVTRHQTWRRKDGERRGAEYRYYQCQSRINRSQCDYRTVKAEDVERQVLAQLRAPVPNGSVVSASDGSSSARADDLSASAGASSAPTGVSSAPTGVSSATDGAASERARTASRLRGIERRYVDYVRMAASGAVPLERVRPALGELDASRRVAEGRLALLEEGGDALDNAISEARSSIAPALWESLAAQERQELARTLLVKVTVKDGRVDVAARA